MRRPLILKRLRGDERGVSVIELGLIAPVVALFIAGIIDLSMGLAQRFQMQQAVNRSLELLITHPPEADADEADADYDYIAAEAAAVAGVEEDQVTIGRWLQCDEERMPNYTDECDVDTDGDEVIDPEEDRDSARYLSLRIDKPFSGS